MEELKAYVNKRCQSIDPSLKCDVYIKHFTPRIEGGFYRVFASFDVKSSFSSTKAQCNS